MPVYTLTRTAKLSTPTGIGEGRVVEGIIARSWPEAAVAIRASSLGLRTITNFILSSGTSLDIAAHTRVVAPGSFANTVRVKTFMRQVGSLRTGTPRYQTFSPAFTATPTITGMPGSPILAITAAQNLSFAALTRKPGSFQHQGTPTTNLAMYVAQGPGSYPLNFVAIGH